MFKITKRVLISTSMIPLLFAFGVASATVVPQQGHKAGATQLIEKVNQNTVIAKGQSYLPKQKGESNKSCS